MVSILMPAYNSQKYIQQAIDSVCAQTYADWELIIIDDCSTDATAKLVQKYSDSRIRYIRNEKNMGAANSRNLGVELARGEWIAYLDSDDAWEKDKLKRQLAAANAKQEKFLFTASAFMDEDGNRSAYVMQVPEKIDFRGLLKQNVISCSSVLITKDLAARYPMVEDRQVHEDFVTWLRILRKENIQAYGVNEPLIVYRISRDSKSGDKKKAAKKTFLAYRRAGVGLLTSCISFVRYAFRSIKKYSKI